MISAGRCKLFRIILIVSAILVAAAVVWNGKIGSRIGMFMWEHSRIAPLATFLSPNDPRLHFAIGNYYFGGGAYDTQKAETYFRETLALDPSALGPHYQLARIYFINANFPEALEEINAELQLHPDFGRSHYVRGLIYGYSGQLVKAETEFKEFLKWKPDSWAGNNDLAWVYFQEGKYKKARDAAQAGLKIEPNNPWLLNSLGVALLNMNDKKGAKEAFTRAYAALAPMTEKDWGIAYPGNNPGIYGEGFSKMKESIQANLELLVGAGT